MEPDAKLAIELSQQVGLLKMDKAWLTVRLAAAWGMSVPEVEDIMERSLIDSGHRWPPGHPAHKPPGWDPLFGESASA